MATELGLMPDIASAFGEDAFGRRAEAAARFFGTPKYILGQTIVVIVWIALNAVAVGLRWDPYPFILLNLAFSTQAAYAAPLILLAQTRQVDRDKAASDQLEAHREEVSRHMQEREAAIKTETDELKALLQSNTQLTQQDKDDREDRSAHTRDPRSTNHPLTTTRSAGLDATVSTAASGLWSGGDRSATATLRQRERILRQPPPLGEALPKPPPRGSPTADWRESSIGETRVPLYAGKNDVWREHGYEEAESACGG